MKKLLLILFALLLAVFVSGQGTRVYNQNIQINKTTPVLDLQGLGAKIYLDGATSGTATLQPPAIAGSAIHTLPSTTGTLINSADTSTMLTNYIRTAEVNARFKSFTANLTAGVEADVTLTGVTTAPYSLWITDSDGLNITEAVKDSTAVSGGVYHTYIYSVDAKTNINIKVLW